ncbi:ROK family transcriptional regulator [Microbacterium sp. ARD32]|uniref:ROK family transcriptional regulator n=1 Tax=Microbacterium sp. ARD32 TaxID=2962577 RepID=UPI0028813F2E|nr:ROK family transcriptional regulator [Microbacterium sp. ARD32]MDT0157799.1 ROK family transcriptional regulator [Microbacterium sp. ARD32]
MTTLTTNAQRMLRALVVDGPAYRADLARALGVTRATVTNLANRLSEDGWVEVTDTASGPLKNLIGTTPRLGVLASVMFLVDTCTVAVSTLDGRLLTERTLTNPSDASASDRLAAGAALVADLLAGAGGEQGLCALHLAVDTQMDARTGDVYSQWASSRWYGVNPKQYFAERFGVPVHTQNTARLEGLAECLWGAGAAHTDVLYVDVSYGVTSGHVVEGIIQSGARGGSGELGHAVYDWNGPVCTCGNSGCLMQYVSVPALLRDLSTGTERTHDWAGFRELVAGGDAAAVTIAARAADILGRMLVSTCHIIDPELLVLSGEVPRSVPSFVDDVAAIVRERTLPLIGKSLRIVPAELDDMPAATARAGIESLRAIDEVVTRATGI